MSQFCSVQNASKTIKQLHNFKLLHMNIRSINAGLNKLNDLLALTKLQRWSPRGRPWHRGHIFKFLALASKP